MAFQNKKNPMAIRSKNALAQALLTLMMKTPFQDISISDITTKAGLSRQTFYTNFAKKEQILSYLLDGLFARYRAVLAEVKNAPEDLLGNYFFFWEKNKDFLSLLVQHDLGHLIQTRNHQFFQEEATVLDEILPVQPWQIPYIKATLAGITWELLLLWFHKEQGLTVSMLSALSMNLLSGKIFA